MRSKGPVILFQALVLGAACLTLASAQSPEKNRAVYLYEGADRAQRLADRARQEGALVVYTSLATSESVPLTQAFEKKYGVKVQLWRSLSDQVVGRALNEAKARRHVVDVVETNGPELEALAREGHVLLSEMVAAGEVPVSLTNYASNADSMKRRNKPIDWKPVQPVIGRPQAIGLAANAPHPNAGLLFADFVLSPEGQQLFHSMGRYPSSRKVASVRVAFPYLMLDPVALIDEDEKWLKSWNALVTVK